jgi:hypothetical protein
MWSIVDAASSSVSRADAEPGFVLNGASLAASPDGPLSALEPARG